MSFVQCIGENVKARNYAEDDATTCAPTTMEDAIFSRDFYGRSGRKKLRLRFSSFKTFCAARNLEVSVCNKLTTSALFLSQHLTEETYLRQAMGDHYP